MDAYLGGNMKTASVTETKSSLSEYLRTVGKTGDEVLVTDRGRVVGRISPPRRCDTPEDIRMEQLELAGVVKRGKGGGIPEDFWNTPAPRGKARLAVEALLAEREEGL
jgi:antitoxin (DNA-binding transcriptional repressor) of toxin-antitoxin stability system